MNQIEPLKKMWEDAEAYAHAIAELVSHYKNFVTDAIPEDLSTFLELVEEYRQAKEREH